MELQNKLIFSCISGCIGPNCLGKYAKGGGSLPAFPHIRSPVLLSLYSAMLELKDIYVSVQISIKPGTNIVDVVLFIKQD